MKIKKLIMGSILALAITLIPMGVSANHTTSHTIEQLQAQLVALQTQLNVLLGNQTVPSATCSFTRSLSLGSVGEDVKCLQKYLNGTSYKVATSGVGSLNNESNYYGSLTQKAVSVWQAGNGVSPAVGFFGPLSQAKYSSLVSVGTPIIVNVAKLTSGNTESMTITKNASNFKMMEVKFDGNGSVNSLTVKRLGFGSNSDYKNGGVYLYKDGIRLAEVRSFNSNDQTATFNNLNLQAPFTLAVMADFEGTTGNIAKVELRGNYNGLPLQSNNFTFAGVQSGTISFSKVGSLTNPVVGERNAQVSEFKISNIVVDGETATVKHIELFNGGSNVLSNVKITDGINTWSGTVNGDRLVFNVNTSIKSSKSKTFKVYADVDGRKDDTIKLYVENTYDVQAIGDTYNFGVVVNTSSFDQASESWVLTLNEKGTLVASSISSDNNVVTLWGNTNKTLFQFKLKANDESFRLNDLSFSVDEDAVKKLYVYSDSILVGSTVVDGNVATVSSDFVLTDEKTLTVKADLNILDASVSEDFVPSLVTVKATGVGSDKDIVGTGSATGNTVYVYSAYPIISRTDNFSSNLPLTNVDVLKLSVKAEGGDIKLASTSAAFTFKVNSYGMPNNLPYKVLVNGVEYSDGTLASTSTQFAPLISNGGNELLIAEGTTKEIIFRFNFVGSDANRGFSLTLEDIDGNVKWLAKDKDGNFKSINYKVDTLNLPIESTQFYRETN